MLDGVDQRRMSVDRELSPLTREKLGQFMTPAPIARFMASLFAPPSGEIVLLDPGAGIGMLTSAFVEQALLQTGLRSITVHAYEIDPVMRRRLEATLQECHAFCAQGGIKFRWQIYDEDFIEAGVALVRNEHTLFGAPPQRFTHCIMNPPYRKINSHSNTRIQLQQIGIETSNLYTGFLAVASHLLTADGELVAIVPRSFCNGVYFRSFRTFFLHEMSFRHIHVFETRDQAFRDNEVLQENIIIHAVKNQHRLPVVITSSVRAELDDLTQREAPYAEVVKPGDSNLFINIAVSKADRLVIERLSVFTSTLAELGVTVSTGPVVDFRLRSDLRQNPTQDTFPLIYPGHLRHHAVHWPKLDGSKPNAIAASVKTQPWLMPNEWYVLIRRFSAKEEKRRIVASVYDPGRVPGKMVGFENHLNVLHRKGSGLSPELARGLALYLNSTLIDLHFRQFSGHTQVNANDLRTLQYPNEATLTRWGSLFKDAFPNQQTIDALLEAEISTMGVTYSTTDPVDAQRKIEEALVILDELGMPKAQRNERSALTLLALFALKPGDKWEKASAPLMGITPIMDFVRDYSAKTYAPNTRETFRRQTMHQFVQAGIAVMNPDEPDRPVNSPKWVYQVTSEVLGLVRSFQRADWRTKVESHLKEHGSLAERYARAREMSKIPLTIHGKAFTLSPGAHSELIAKIIYEFGPRFAPGAEVLYIGDTGAKTIHLDVDTMASLGLSFDVHGKFPDVVLFHRAMNWLYLIEAVTSHGPVDSERHLELADLFADSTAGLVFVTAFPDRRSLGRYASEISWETEVWVADHPEHLIHYNGENFLGPHKGGGVGE
ncbi:MAG TPA: BsuBI/PstI family type II restriction endonuclease [Caldilinea sp.]|mgnify:CR=1 FL=1|nr:BsuBI/PstI family type II restriction endonuclease [Caldilinea sp.]